MSDLKPIPPISPAASPAHAPERLQERPSQQRRYKREPEGDRFELHADTNPDEPIEEEPGHPVEEPVHIDIKA